MVNDMKLKKNAQCDFHSLYLQNTRMIYRLGWTCSMDGMTDVYKISVVKPNGRNQLWDAGVYYKIILKLVVEIYGVQNWGLNLCGLTAGCYEFLAHTAGNFLTNWAFISSSSRIVLRGVLQISRITRGTTHEVAVCYKWTLQCSDCILNFQPPQYVVHLWYVIIGRHYFCFPWL